MLLLSLFTVSIRKYPSHRSEPPKRRIPRRHKQLHLSISPTLKQSTIYSQLALPRRPARSHPNLQPSEIGPVSPSRPLTARTFATQRTPQHVIRRAPEVRPPPPMSSQLGISYRYLEKSPVSINLLYLLTKRHCFRLLCLHVTYLVCNTISLIWTLCRYRRIQTVIDAYGCCCLFQPPYPSTTRLRALSLFKKKFKSRLSSLLFFLYLLPHRTSPQLARRVIPVAIQPASATPVIPTTADNRPLINSNSTSRVSSHLTSTCTKNNSKHKPKPMKTSDSASPPLAPSIAIMPTDLSVGAMTSSSSSSAQSQSQPKPRWNSKNLSWRMAADASSAACAGALIAPIITIIDRSIMENASGRSSLANSIRSSLRTLLLRPQSLLLSKPTALVFALYSGTYMTANSLDTLSATLSNRPASSITSGPAKFAASSAANVGLCVYKDQVFVRMFGPPGAVPRPVPLPSYILFTMRDCLTIFASFNLPPLLAPWVDSRLSDKLRRHVSGLTTAQFIAPASVQLFSTPIHLLGLDMYNRPGGTFRERWQVVRSNWLVSTAARMCRIIPAFGVGGVVNLKMRRHLMGKLE